VADDEKRANRALRSPPSQFLFEFLIVAFDDPALLGGYDQILALGFFRQVRQPVLDRFCFFRRPALRDSRFKRYGHASRR
jgi:hypothetical protein